MRKEIALTIDGLGGLAIIKVDKEVADHILQQCNDDGGWVNIFSVDGRSHIYRKDRIIEVVIRDITEEELAYTQPGSYLTAEQEELG